MLNDIEVTFPSLGLTERQEAVVAELLRNTAARISQLYAEGLNIGAHLEAIRHLEGSM
jgi:hypothetical protein